MTYLLRLQLVLVFALAVPLIPAAIAQVPDDVPHQAEPFLQNERKPAPAIARLSDVEADAPNVNVSNLSGNEAEVSIAVNPLNRNNQVIAGHAPGFGTMNTFYTTDGGQTWTLVALGDAQDGRTSTFRFDPTVTIAGDGNVYVAYGLDDDGDGNRYLLVARSTDGGASYDQFTTVDVDDSLDKWIIGSGPSSSTAGQFNVYVAYRLTTAGIVNVRLASSYDQGTTFAEDQQVNDGGSLNTFGMPAVGPGGEVYVVWDDQDNRPTSTAIRVDVSTDDGATFGGDVLVSTSPVARGNTNRYDIPAAPSRGILAVPSIAADRSGGTYNGRVYVTYTTVGGGGFNDTDIALRFSDDQGASWSSEVIVNTDGGSTSQFLPWVDVDQQTGQVVVVWYDTRNDATNVQKAEVFIGVSDDGGATFDNILVSDGQSDESGNWGNDYLEYIGVASLGGVAFPAWADNSLTPSDLDFFTDQVAIGTPPVADAGPDQTVECAGFSGAEVTLDASGSSDADGDALTYTWYDGATVIAGPTTNATVQVTLAEGVHTITLEVDDGNLLTDTDEVTITVEDTTKPLITLNGPAEITLECALDDYTELGATVTDACDANPTLSIDDSALDLDTPGEYTIVYTAVDASGNQADPVERTVVVVDTTPPELTVASAPTTFWPPNHKYRTLDLANLDMTATDACYETVSADDVVIAATSSDEGENIRGGGDGNTVDDIVIGSCRTVELRSERLQSSNGRVYTLALQVADGSGNVGEATYQVHVPADIDVSALATDDGAAYTVAGCDLTALISDAVSGADGLDPSERDPRQDALAAPTEFALHPNRPNPFSSVTAIAFSLPESVPVTLDVYDALGRRVAMLYDREVLPSGRHVVIWNTADVPSGTYFYRLSAGTFQASRSMSLAK